jgi:thioredoxin reductase
VFPTLTTEQVARIAAHGRRRAIARGDVLVETGDKVVPFFVVLSGEIQVLGPSEAGDTVIVTIRPGQFSGEGNMITGRRSLARLRVSEPGDVIELDREQLLALVQTDAELSEILMRAFILRRSELITGGHGDVVVIGSTHCAGTLTCEQQPYALEMDDGARVAARALIIATGAEYRRPALVNLAQFEGAGVYYAAMPMEAQLCVGQEIIVVGGGNSAGQAAVFLAQTAKRVHMLVRGEGLADTMSRYLIRRIEDNPAIVLRTRVEVVALEGDRHVERVRCRDNRTGSVETNDIRHVFMMTGAVPNTGWLDRCIARDEKGFIKTGSDLSPDDLAAAAWPLPRAPYLLETSRPGVFAVGDVRGGNIKRVASAVGEGSIAIAFVHQVLHQ